MDHIDLMDDLRDSIGMRGYAQHDPVVEYKREGYDMFEAMNETIQRDAVRLIMRARLTAADPAPKRRVPTQLLEGRGSSGWSRASEESRMAAGSSSTSPEARSGDGTAPTPYKKKHIPGRNEPCWCGSGKKYKNCHLRQDEQESM
jgi:preprotein translocase subunit SecA